MSGLQHTPGVCGTVTSIRALLDKAQPAVHVATFHSVAQLDRVASQH